MRKFLNAFRRDERATISVIFSLSIIPLLIGAGVAIDYGRGLTLQTRMSTALDLATLSAVQKPEAERTSFASAVFLTMVRDNIVNSPVFTNQPDGSLHGIVTATMPTMLLTLMNKNSILISAKARASRPVLDESCVLAFGKNSTITDNALRLNGASNTDLTGCTLRSNVSMVCNGHTGNADQSFAAGNSTNCNNPQSNAGIVPDIHEALAVNIEKQCGLASYNIDWSQGSPPPSSPRMITRVKNGLKYYHVCGNLTASGSGILSGTNADDSVLVIENGRLSLAKNANISLERTTLILTGDNSSSAHQLEFPQGNGHSASLTISPAQDSANPWQGVAIYQDPSLTANVNMSWGPGATLKVDGLLYFPNANLTMSGVAQSHNAECSKLVVNELVSNGAINFKQTESGCSSIGLKQHKAPPRLIF